MPYSADHSEQTRERILDSAARLFRWYGFQRARIGDIMAEASLTHGGFYAHFESKEDLFASVLVRELEFTTRLREATAEGTSAGLDAVEYYLTPDNVGRVAKGCTLVANAADIARAPLGARAAFTHAFTDLASEFEALLAKRYRGDRSRALAALATCVGAVTLAHAVTDRAVSEELLEAARACVMRELGHSARASTT